MPQNKINRNAHMNSTGHIKGDPGYRTRGNRFGFDPIDTPAESARYETAQEKTAQT
jgi:inosine/xanthosine triphosphate pyrophosphatase family protein